METMVQSHYREALKRAGHLAQAADHHGALAAYDEAIGLAPCRADAHYEMGLLHHKQGELAEAVACFERAAELAPEDATVWNNLGVLHFAQRAWVQAEKAFRQALGLDERYGDAWYGLGRVLLGQGREAEAAEALRVCLSWKPGHGKARQELNSLGVDLALLLADDAHLKTKVSQFDYKAYWERRYRKGGDSGAGSRGVLAEYKTRVINALVRANDIHSVVEFGCGDGSQLQPMDYGCYLGLDVSPRAVELCHRLFEHDATKSFMLYSPQSFHNAGFIRADLVVCLDVLYHITDEDDYHKTLHDIFSCASKYVVLYTIISRDRVSGQPARHIRIHDTISDLSAIPGFKIWQIVEQEHKDLSSAEFVVLKKDRQVGAADRPECRMCPEVG